MVNYETDDLFRKVCDEAEKLEHKDLTEIDTEFLVDLLLEMSNDFRDSVIEWVGTIISHRYKIQNIPKEKEYLIPQWKVTVNKSIGNIQRKFKRSPSLKKFVLNNWDEVLDFAMDDYKDAQVRYSDLPDIQDTECSWSLDELLVRYTS